MKVFLSHTLNQNFLKIGTFCTFSYPITLGIDKFLTMTIIFLGQVLFNLILPPNTIFCLLFICAEIK